MNQVWYHTWLGGIGTKRFHDLVFVQTFIEIGQVTKLHESRTFGNENIRLHR